MTRIQIAAAVKKVQFIKFSMSFDRCRKLITRTVTKAVIKHTIMVKRMVTRRTVRRDLLLMHSHLSAAAITMTTTVKQAKNILTLNEIRTSVHVILLSLKCANLYAARSGILNSPVQKSVKANPARSTWDGVLSAGFLQIAAKTKAFPVAVMGARRNAKTLFVRVAQ